MSAITQNAAPNTAPAKARTLVVDTARLLKQNKITQQDLSKLDKAFRDEVVAYAASMPAEESMAGLNLKPSAINMVAPVIPPKPPVPKPVPQPPPPPPPPPSKPLPKVEPKVEPKPVPPLPKPEPKPEPKPAPKPEPIISSPLTPEQVLHLHQDELKKKREAASIALRESQFERNNLLQQLESTRAKEKDVEMEEAAVKKSEMGTSATELKPLEEKRWSLEDKRQLFEKDRWELHKKLDAVDIKISESYKLQSAIEAEEQKTKLELERLMIIKEAKQAAISKVEEEKVYAAIQSKKKKYESDWVRMKEDIKNIRNRVNATDEEALNLKQQIEEIEKQEVVAMNEKDRHAFEEKRWSLDQKLRDIEKVVWQLDADVEVKTKEIDAIEKVFSEIQLEEETSKDKLNRYALAIKKAE